MDTSGFLSLLVANLDCAGRCDGDHAAAVVFFEFLVANLYGDLLTHRAETGFVKEDGRCRGVVADFFIGFQGTQQPVVFTVVRGVVAGRGEYVVTVAVREKLLFWILRQKISN